MKRIINLTLFIVFGSLLQAQILQPVSISLPADFGEEQVKAAIFQKFPPSHFVRTRLSLSYTRQTPAGQYWHFQQTFRDKPIYHASIKVKINTDNRIPFMLNNLLETMLSPKPEKDRFSLTEMGIRVLLLKRMSTFNHHPEAIWFPQQGELIAAYKVNSYAYASTESYELILDAATGEELQKTDIRAYHNHQTMADTTGQGRVFLPNPCTAAGASYGTQFSNNDDMHLPIFETYMDTIELKDLKYENGQFLLEGPYVKLMEFSIPNVPPVSSTDGDFFFNRSETGFEDVMAYYHIDTFQRYVQRLGYTDLYSTTPILVDAHGAAGNDQSSFSTNGRIQYGTNYAASNEHVDDAEDADVIIHEYGHALSHAAAPNTRSGNQRIGLEEGYCDYFAAAYSYDIRSDYGWDKVFNWDGHNEFWAGRSANTSRKFSTSGLGRYDYAEIWSSAMMRLRQDIGATECDRLQIEVLYGGANGLTFPQAYQLLLYADTALFGGIYYPQITDRFCEIDVVTGTVCLHVDLDTEIDKVNWTAFYVEGEGICVNTQAGFNGNRPTGFVRLTNTLGQIIDQKTFSGNQPVVFSSLAKGLYIVSLEEEGGMKASRKVVVW